MFPPGFCWTPFILRACSEWKYRLRKNNFLMIRQVHQVMHSRNLQHLSQSCFPRTRIRCEIMWWSFFRKSPEPFLECVAARSNRRIQGTDRFSHSISGTGLEACCRISQRDGDIEGNQAADVRGRGTGGWCPWARSKQRGRHARYWRCGCGIWSDSRTGLLSFRFQALSCQSGADASNRKQKQKKKRKKRLSRRSKKLVSFHVKTRTRFLSAVLHLLEIRWRCRYVFIFAQQNETFLRLLNRTLRFIVSASWECRKINLSSLFQRIYFLVTISSKSDGMELEIAVSRHALLFCSGFTRVKRLQSLRVSRLLKRKPFAGWCKIAPLSTVTVCRCLLYLAKCSLRHRRTLQQLPPPRCITNLLLLKGNQFFRFAQLSIMSLSQKHILFISSFCVIATMIMCDS